MRIVCRLIPVSNPSELPYSALPTHDLEISAYMPHDIPHLLFFQELLDDFNKNGDTLISELFDKELSGRYFEIVVIATHGIPDPYDAWCTEYLGMKSVFFNLSLWTKDDLKSDGLPVLKHEVAHVLLNELLPKPDTSNPINFSFR